jgi:hypothetical protein
LSDSCHTKSHRIIGSMCWYVYSDPSGGSTTYSNGREHLR